MVDWTKDYGPAETVEAVKAWGIYCDFDGNAPYSYSFIYCSTLELAAEAVVHLRKWDEIEGELETGPEIEGPDGEMWEFCIPMCEGWEFSKSFAIEECVAKRSTVCRTMADVLKAISD